jgi:hypothetical protein
LGADFFVAFTENMGQVRNVCDRQKVWHTIDRRIGSGFAH